MFKFDTLIDVATGFEQTKAVRPQDFEHRIVVTEIFPDTSKVCILNRMRQRHDYTLEIDTGKECLGQWVSQVPGHLHRKSAYSLDRQPR